jgi:hypothetical protein
MERGPIPTEGESRRGNRYCKAWAGRRSEVDRPQPSHIAGANCPMEWGGIGIGRTWNHRVPVAQLHVLPSRWCEYVSEVMHLPCLQASSWHPRTFCCALESQQ